MYLPSYLLLPQAKDRIQYYQLDDDFVFPYDMGSRWKNFKQVFTWSGVPEEEMGWIGQLEKTVTSTA